MPQSELRLVRRSAEFMPKEQVSLLPRRLRGIYVLYKEQSHRGRVKYDVLYVGMSAAGRRGGLRGRLWSHARSRRKGKLWTHFSAFEIWDNIRDEEVAELRGSFPAHLPQRLGRERSEYPKRLQEGRAGA
jgi:hypothetical protein